jgi:hypothetical protein
MARTGANKEVANEGQKSIGADHDPWDSGLGGPYAKMEFPGGASVAVVWSSVWARQRLRCLGGYAAKVCGAELKLGDRPRQ